MDLGASGTRGQSLEEPGEVGRRPIGVARVAKVRPAIPVRRPAVQDHSALELELMLQLPCPEDRFVEAEIVPVHEYQDVPGSCPRESRAQRLLELLLRQRNAQRDCSCRKQYGRNAERQGSRAAIAGETVRRQGFPVGRIEHFHPGVRGRSSPGDRAGSTPGRDQRADQQAVPSWPTVRSDRGGY